MLPSFSLVFSESVTHFNASWSLSLESTLTTSPLPNGDEEEGRSHEEVGHEVERVRTSTQVEQVRTRTKS